MTTSNHGLQWSARCLLGKNYAVIYQCNDILDAIAEKETAGQTEAEDIINKGEASFFRAYCYSTW